MSHTPAFHAWRALRRILPAAVLTALAVSPAFAQSHRTAIGLTGSWSSSGDLTPGLSSETVLESGWAAGLQLETWLPSGRFGFRTSGTFASLPDQAGETYEVINGDVALLGRLLPAWHRRNIMPYALLGVGGVQYRAPEGVPPVGGGLYGPNPITRAVAVGGLGVDLLQSARFGLRVEAVDRMVLLSLGEAPESQGLPATHTFHVTTALQLRLGLLRHRAGVPPAGPGARQLAPAKPRRAQAAAEAAEVTAAPAEEVVATPEAPARRDPVTPATESRPAAAAPVGNGRREPLGAPVPPAAEPKGVAAPQSPVGKPVAAAPAPAAPQVLYTVQVGSLLDRDTARRRSAELAERGIPAWSVPVTEEGQDLVRLRVGVLGSESEAQGLAGSLMRRYGWPLSVDRITSQDRPPAGARKATHDFLYGG